LLSIRSRRVKLATCFGLHATPEAFRLLQCPLAAYRLRQAPVNHRGGPVTGAALWSVESGRIFSQLSLRPHPVRFPLAGVSSVVTGLRHCFRSLAPVSPDRILSLDATSTPRSGAALPGLSPGSYRIVRFFRCDLSTESCATFLDVLESSSCAFTLAGSQRSVG